MASTSPIRLGLEAVRAVSNALGQPHLATPTVLVAGTNGKGSTASMLESIARAGGIRVGLFHSPSLGEEHEQIRIDGEPIDGELYARLLEDIGHGMGGVGELLTPFEATTVAAFLAFSRADLDLAVIEVGLGGARDATNIAEPIVSVLTTVDLDHQAYLGDTLESITREKAGVFRPGRAAVLGFLHPSAFRVACQVAKSAGAHCVTAKKEVRRLSGALNDRFVLQTHIDEYVVRLPLAGEHQRRNAAVAVLAAEHLRSLFPTLDEIAIVGGLEAVRCPGRLESVEVMNLGVPGVFILDAAHNLAAARVLAESIAGLKQQPDLLFGAFADKDASGMLDILRPSVGRVMLTPIEHPRSWNPADHASYSGTELVDSPLEGLAQARPRTPLLIAGSMQLVGDVRRLLMGPKHPSISQAARR